MLKKATDSPPKYNRRKDDRLSSIRSISDAYDDYNTLKINSAGFSHKLAKVVESLLYTIAEHGFTHHIADGDGDITYVYLCGKEYDASGWLNKSNHK